MSDFGWQWSSQNSCFLLFFVHTCTQDVKMPPQLFQVSQRFDRHLGSSGLSNQSLTLTERPLSRWIELEVGSLSCTVRIHNVATQWLFVRQSLHFSTCKRSLILKLSRFWGEQVRDMRQDYCYAYYLIRRDYVEGGEIWGWKTVQPKGEDHCHPNSDIRSKSPTQIWSAPSTSGWCDLGT